MIDRKSPVEQALDLMVFAPVGLVLSVRDELPRLVEKGRQRVLSQVTLARMVGELAVATGQRKAEQLVRQATGRPPEPSTTPATSPIPAAGAGPPVPPAEDPTPLEPPAVVAALPAADGPPVATLAIPGYDALSAPQVVQRLDGLSEEELAAVAAYEAATRRRKTILSRIAQLQSRPT